MSFSFGAKTRFDRDTIANSAIWRTFSGFEEASTAVPGPHAHQRLLACMPRMGVTISATGVRYNANPTEKSMRVLRRLTNLASDRDT